MKVTWEFDPDDPADNGRIHLYQTAQGMHNVLWDISQYLRDKLKYGEEASHDSIVAYEEFGKVFRELLDDHKIDLDL